MDNISVEEWKEIKSILLEVRENVSKLVDAAGKELLTPNEVCKMLKICRNTYQNYVNDGVFKQIRIGKNKNSRVFIRRSDIERLIDEGRL